MQVYADDVLTKEEQIGLLFKAKRKCEGHIKSKLNISGEYRKVHVRVETITHP